ncbi:glycoside hydrolase family 9 protein [soil metagenome]
MHMLLTKYCILVLILSISISVTGQQLAENIRLNQIGFYPDAPKIAVVVDFESESDFYLARPEEDEQLFSGKMGAQRQVKFSDRTTRIADFSSFTKPGTYVIVIPELGHSYPFEIKENAHREISKASIKGFYFQRMSTELPDQYAGKWSRPAGHPDEKIIVHPSAASPERPAGTIISAPKGWYDAGDYNKYVVNSGITMGTLLSAYEDFPEYFQDLDLNIPESNNQVPDILDEVLWNLRWMLNMQDPHDGGVYHKLTTPGFEGLTVKPHEAKKDRYVVQKGTAAALNFAAVTAQASRIYTKYNNEFPGLADSCIEASKKAWDWALKNPDFLYMQNEMNQQYEPDITTGAYGDQDVSDEFIWAASELFATTGDGSYLESVELFPDQNAPVPSWSQVRTLGYFTLAKFNSDFNKVSSQDAETVKKLILSLADSLISGVNDRAYQTVMGGTEQDFIWGSSAVAANQGIVLIQAYKITSNKEYLDYALTNLDYLLGRNATGYSFVTGHGSKTAQNPHHRLSVSSVVEEPVPGLLIGGPNANAPRQDKCPGYTSTAADEVYIDDDCSYASNEIAINWNAPLAYLASALEALQHQAAFSTKGN